MISHMVVEYSASPWSLFTCFLREFLSHEYLYMFVSNGDVYGRHPYGHVCCYFIFIYYYQLQFFYLILVIDICIGD